MHTTALRVSVCMTSCLCLAVAGTCETATSIHERPYRHGPRHRIGRSCVWIPVINSRDLRWASHPCPVLVHRLALSRLECRLDQTNQRLGSRGRGGGACDLAVERDLEGHLFDILRDILVDERVGEPGKGGRADIGEDLCLGAAVNDIERVIDEVLFLVHAFTPTRTFANRPGDSHSSAYPNAPTRILRRAGRATPRTEE